LRDLLAACALTGEWAALQQSTQRAWLRYRFLMERAGFAQAWLDYQPELLDRLQQ
jgi:hypothetical protein